MGDKDGTSHSAEGSALGFWYQSLYALLILLEQSSDDAAVGIEQLDDIALTADGHDLLYQLKHSIAAKPLPVGIKSRSLWRTVKVWIDLLPKVSLAETGLHLVTVGGIVEDDPLAALSEADSDRDPLASAMAEEAQRVVEARAEAKANGQSPLPYADRKDGCEAFLSLPPAIRLNLMRRVTLKIESPTVGEIEGHIEARLTLLPAGQRAHVAKKLIEWWDRQIVYSLCGKRERVIGRPELQAQISEIVGELDQGKLSADFETVQKPLEYQPDGMLTRQIALVKGGNADIDKAIREEWRARAQRARWATENPALASMINDYDAVLTEHWSDRHSQMVEDCKDFEEDGKCKSGLDLLRWTHNEAPTAVRPIQEGFGAAYYVRGSYQVLAIGLQVGWHPDYKDLLKEGE
ncbi:MAG: ABC-three component system protein [Allosphingosinicella sp.]|uniref:ABC-three component system protein n=1 Tax=Allosphingosinicella sp. TaxID=2823234 RepID=UPI00393C2A48